MPIDDERPNEIAPFDESDFGPLAWEGRVFAVSLVWLMPGTILGLILAVVAMAGPSFAAAAATVGGLMGATAGGLLEADHWGRQG